MMKEKAFLEDVGIKDLPFPMKVISKSNPEGQPTIASISIDARIMAEFEAEWIDTFIRILHSHRDKIGTETLAANIPDYLKELKASMVIVNFNYPFFIEKITPVSKEKCLVRYMCTYSVKASVTMKKPKVIFKIAVPVLTTYPLSGEDKLGGLFAQLSVVNVEVEPKNLIYPEDIVSMVDKHSIAPVYSFLTKEDQRFIINKLHTEKKTSVILTDEIKDELARNREIEWYKVGCANYGMLHSYLTLVSTEKSMWIPFSGIEEDI
jgi:GTP cyclohydrolase IB